MSEGRARVRLERAVAAVLVVHALGVFVLCARTVALVAEGEGPVVVASGASPHARVETVSLRALALDPARERPLARAPTVRVVDDDRRTSIDALSEDGVTTVRASRAVRAIAWSLDDGVDVEVELASLAPAQVRVRPNPAERDVQGARAPPIHVLRPRASSFVDTEALVVVGDAIERETLRADPGRVLDRRGRLLPIERAEIDVELPPILRSSSSEGASEEVNDGQALLRAPSAAPLFIDLLVVAARDLASASAGASVDALALALHTERGRGPTSPVARAIPPLGALDDGDLVLVVAKGSPYPRARGVVAPAVVARDHPTGEAAILSLVERLVPDDALLACARARPALVDDDVLRALLSRVQFEVLGLPAAGPPPSTQRALAARAHEQRVDGARAIFRVAGASFVALVVVVALVLVFSRRRTLADAIDDDEPPVRDRTGLKAALAVAVVAAIVFTLDVVARLAW